MYDFYCCYRTKPRDSVNRDLTVRLMNFAFQVRGLDDKLSRIDRMLVQLLRNSQIDIDSDSEK